MSKQQMETFFQWYDRAGRPTLRLVGVLILAAIGLAIAVAFFRWAFGYQLPELPGSAILLALVPQIPQVVDQLTRSFERRSQIHMGLHPAGAALINPHGGPAAP